MKITAKIKNAINFAISRIKTNMTPEQSLEYKNVQRIQNIRRFKSACAVLFIFNAISILLHIKLEDSLDIKPIINNQFISALFLITTAIFWLIFSSFEKPKASASLQWFFCYAFILAMCSVQFLKIINVTVNMQPTFPFIILINLLIIVPDFKPSVTIFFILLIFLGTILIQLFFLPISVFAINKMMNITTFTAICIFTCVFLYSRNVQVYLNTVQLKEMNEHLALLSTTDELTGLPNRRSFNYFYENIWSHCQRLKLPLCVVMIDIDNFKLYNDTLGHTEGDMILQTLGKHLRTCIKRETDFIARYGGEEFVGILPYLKSEEIPDFLNTVLQSIKALKIPTPSPNNSFLTVSIGAALATPTASLTKEALLECADNALYEAKDSGKNRVVFHNLKDTTG